MAVEMEDEEFRPEVSSMCGLRTNGNVHEGDAHGKTEKPGERELTANCASGQ